MRIVYSIATIAVVLIIFGVIRSHRTTPIVNLDSSGTTVVAFGDSLIKGVGATSGNDFISLLSTRIGEPIINLGKSGDTTSAALERLDEALALDPKIVIILLGGNDALRRVPRERTFSNLDSMISRIQSEGAAVLLLGVRGGLFSDGYGDDFERLSRDRGTAYVPDVLDGIFGNPDLMYDQIHPNDKGYTRIADKVFPVLNKILLR